MDVPDDLSAAWDADSVPMQSGPDHGGDGRDAYPIARPEGIVPLGHDRGVFYYLSLGAGQIYDLTPSQHSKSSLMAMASVPYYWENTRFKSEKSGIKWDEAADNLMHECRIVGIYDSNRVRGRGVWMDNGRAVLHVGDRLVVNGRECSINLANSKHVYEAAQALTASQADPLSNAQANKLVEICQGLRWERGISGTLLAGFIAVSPICGGLSWRPTIWVVGGSGSGKTYLKDNILIPSLGGIALQVQSKTSEAGIRQTLGSDARPVIFDEAESEDHAAAVRMQSVLDLVRQSSSDGGADIVKGSSDGRARRYRIRSCFGFFSINAAILHEADANRITVLAMRSRKATTQEDEASFQKFHQMVVDTITPEYSAGLVARSVWLLPVIRQNAETFAQAVSVHLGSRRTGDQIGTLLAGAYSLHSDRAISPKQAREFVERQDWSDAAVDETDRDEHRLLSYLTQQRVRFNGGNGTSGEATIGRLIFAVRGSDGQIMPEVADMELKQIGLRHEYRENGSTGIYISTNHPGLRRILKETPWEKGWSRALLRLDGAESSAGAKRFGPGSQSKATWIPIETIEPPEPASSHTSPVVGPNASR